MNQAHGCETVQVVSSKLQGGSHRGNGGSGEFGGRRPSLKGFMSGEGAGVLTSLIM